MLKISTKFIIIFILVFGAVFFGSLSVLAQADMAEVDVGDVAGTDVSALPEVPDAESEDFLAEAQCELNGQPVPCDELFESVDGLVGWGIGFFIVLFVVGIVAFIFWLMMIIHAASHPIENKAMWIIILVLTGIIGAIIYYFAVKRKFNKQGPPTTAPTA